MENIKTNQQNQPQQLTGETKKCRKCGSVLPATVDFFYRNSGGKFGLTPRCKPCVNEDNKASHAARLLRDPEKVRAQATERTKRSYRKNLEVNRKKHREFQAKKRANPVEREKINARKRAAGAGLTPEQIRAIFDSQGGVCAICGSSDPGSKAGWNLDHCHSTGRIRFILCTHCNRGLGAFRDDSNLMRKAADMLEKIRNRSEGGAP